MSRSPRLKKNYVLAKCCTPAPPDSITGYYSYDKILKVHRHDCRHLDRVEPERLIKLEWQEIIEQPPKGPGDDFADLDAIDFAVLQHHKQYGIDYSLMLAKMLSIPKQKAFERHQRLKEAGLLRRVDAVMVRYRKGVVDNKWIKHRNHTYYELTEKGEQYLTYFVSNIEQGNQNRP
jgi:hypothetical protein